MTDATFERHTPQSEAGFLQYLDLRPWRELILQRSYDDFRASALKTYLGAFWWFVDPLITMLIYYLVFGIFFERGGPDFIPFLITGIVVYHYFAHVVREGCMSIYKSKGLIRQVGIPKIIFPITNMLVQTYQLGFSVVLLALVLLFYSTEVTVHYLAFPIVLVVVLLLAESAAMLLGSVVPFIPDLSRLANYALRLGYFVCGIQYAVDELGETPQLFLRLNPLTHMVDAARDCLMYGRWPDWPMLALCAALGIGGCLAGAAIIWRLDMIYARDMEQ